MLPPLTATQAVQRYREREEAYFNNLTDEEQTVLMHHGLTAADSFLFGEFAFVLLGLKPCLLIDLPRAVAEGYYDCVLDPLLPMLTSLDLCQCRIDHPLKSAEMTSLEGMRVIYQKHQYDRVAATLLHALPGVITEDALGRLLDYPGSLPADETQLGTMVEVIYYIHAVTTTSRRIGGQGKETKNLALATFAAQEFELGRVREHFKRYQEACRSRLGMELFLLVRRPALS